jgi:hypothetical protein
VVPTVGFGSIEPWLQLARASASASCSLALDGGGLCPLSYSSTACTGIRTDGATKDFLV